MAKSHTPATENITGDLDQLLSDVKSWSEKARICEIQMLGQDATTPMEAQ